MTYNALHYAANKVRINERRRAKYAADTNWRQKRERRRRSVQKTNAKKKAEYRRLVDEIKKAPCLDCGKMFPPVCMDFDHVRGSKCFQIGQMGQRQLHLVLAEIAKCDLVCANCHRIRTLANQQHGYGRQPR